MPPLIKRLGFAGLSALNMEWLKKRSPIGVIAPFYHLVSDKPVPHIDKLYPYQDSRQFEADLDQLLRHFQPLGLDDIIRQQQTGRPFEKKGFLISFDDGLRQVYETAAPILLRKGVPAALFLNPSFVDNKDLFYNFKKGLILDRLDNTRNAEKFLAPASAPSAKNSTRSRSSAPPSARSIISTGSSWMHSPPCSTSISTPSGRNKGLL